jgi:sulfite exporter TauE/SafE
MLSSINPLGERARGQRFWLTSTWYVLGSLMGGMAIGAVSALIGSRLPDGGWRLAASIAVLIAGVVLELTDRVPPSLHRQVDEDWLTRYRGWVYGFGFGAQLGVGVATIVTSASVYATIAVAALSGSVWTGAIIGAVFGLVRSLPILMVAQVDDPATLRRVMRRVQDQLTMARWSVVGSQGLMILLLVATS